MSSSLPYHTWALTSSAIRAKIHQRKDIKSSRFHKLTFCSHPRHLYDRPLNLPSTCLTLLLSCPQPGLRPGALLKPFSQAPSHKDNAPVSKHLTFSSLLSCAFSVFASWRLACSPALWAAVRGLYVAGAAYLGDSIAPCVHERLCVVGCQLICACVGWRVVSLLSMRHTSRHTCCADGGGGCCVRAEGAVGVLSELDLGFLFYTSQSGCYGIVEYRCCVWASICVWIGEGVDQIWKQRYDGSHTYPVPFLSALSFFLCSACVFLVQAVGAPFQSNSILYWRPALHLYILPRKTDIVWCTESGQYVNVLWVPAVLTSNRGGHSSTIFQPERWVLYDTTDHPAHTLKSFSPPAFYSYRCLLHHEIQSLLPYLWFHLLICE